MKINFKNIIVIAIISLLVLDFYLTYNDLYEIQFIIYQIPILLVFLHYVFIIKNRNMWFLIYILFNALYFSFLNIEITQISYSISTYILIIGNLCLILYLAKKINFKHLFQKYFFQIVLLSSFTLYLIYSIYTFLAINGAPWQMKNIITEITNYTTLIILFNLSLLNYANSDSKKELLLFLYCFGQLFDNIIYAMIDFSDSKIHAIVFKYLDCFLFFLSYIPLLYYSYHISLTKNKTFSVSFKVLKNKAFLL